jgi:hypothetical protein
VVTLPHDVGFSLAQVGQGTVAILVALLGRLTLCAILSFHLAGVINNLQLAVPDAKRLDSSGK